MSSDFNKLYRPSKLSDVVGQDSVIRTLEQMYKKGTLPSTFLLYGGAGLGKTTVARIIAKLFGCDPVNILEINAANNTGINDMRTIIKFMEYPAIGSNPTKVIIIDEAHRISSAGTDALLKPLEEPPDYVKVILCTTEVESIPTTLRRRCKEFKFKDVGFLELTELITNIAEKEKIPHDSSILKFIAKAANGSPANAVSFLEQTRYCKSKDEVAEVLSTHVEEKDTIDLCRFIAGNNLAWKEAQKLLNDLKGKNPESIRIQVANYLVSCILGAKSEKVLFEFARRLDCFSKPAASFSDIVLNTLEVISYE